MSPELELVSKYPKLFVNYGTAPSHSPMAFGFYLDRLKKLSAHTKPEDYVFCGMDGEPLANFNKSFAKVLAALKLHIDRGGRKRSIYSLRHFYCTQVL